jgi:hypothetical protein
VPQQRGRHKQQRHRPGPQRARHPRHERFGSLAGLRRGTIVLVAALAATVPATAVGVGVKTVLAPTPSGPPAARAVLPAPIVVDDAAPTTTARGKPASTPNAGAAASGSATGTGSPSSGASSAPHHRATTAAALGIRPISYWQAQFDDSDASTFRTATALTTSSDSSDYYDAAYYVDAYTSMWEATSQTRYLGRAVSLVNNMISRARPSSSFGGGFHDGYLGWVTQRSDVAGQEVPLYESYMWRYVARLIRVMPTTGAYADDRARFLAFTEKNIFDKWMARGASDNVYRSRTHMAAHWAYIGLELSRTTHSASRRAAALAVATNVDRNMPNSSSSLRGQMHTNPSHPGAYVWSAEWGRTSPVQDVGHGNGVIAYVAEAYTLGKDWTQSDMERFGGTLRVISPTAEFVDGSGDDTGWWPDGWVKLGRADPAIQKLLETHGRAITAQYMAAMAENVKLLTLG